MSHRLSVVIPAYNHGSFIGQALNSVLEQTDSSAQVIVIDDGSTDDTAAVVAGFPSVVYERQDNAGASVARNRGVELADGDVLAFLDADDLMAPGAVSLLIAALEGEPELDVVFGHVEEFVDESVVDRERWQVRKQAGYRTGSMFVRMQSFLKVGQFDASLKLGQVVDWLARAQTSGLKTLTLPDVVLLRRLHNSNSSSNYAEVGKHMLTIARAAARRARQ